MAKTVAKNKITLTQAQAIEVYKTVRKLETQDMPGEYADVLFNIRKALEPRYQFQNEQEMKFVNSNGCTLTDTGEIHFKSEDDKQAYIKKLEEIGSIEIDLQIEKKKFGIRGLTMNCKDRESLDLVTDIVC